MSRQQTTNREHGIDTARANLLTNPGFEIWQRGAGPFTLGGHSADRWQCNMAASCTYSATKVAASTVVAGETGYVLRCAYTAGGGSVNSGVLQYINEQCAELNGLTLTFSILVWCNAANSVRPAFYDNINVYRYGPYHPGNSTWVRLSVTAPMGPNATTSVVGVVMDASSTFYLDDATLVPGYVAAEYAPLHPADDLNRCQRYYQYFDMNGVVIGGSAAGVGQREFSQMSFISSMGGTVTFTISATATWSKINTSNTVPDRWGGNSNVFGLSIYASAAGEFFLQGTAGSFVTLEWNPP